MPQGPLSNGCNAIAEAARTRSVVIFSDSIQPSFLLDRPRSGAGPCEHWQSDRQLLSLPAWAPSRCASRSIVAHFDSARIADNSASEVNRVLPSPIILFNARNLRSFIAKVLFSDINTPAPKHKWPRKQMQTLLHTKVRKMRCYTASLKCVPPRRPILWRIRRFTTRVRVPHSQYSVHLSYAGEAPTPARPDGYDF